MKAHGFGSGSRIRRRSEFQRVFDVGRRVQGRFLTLVVARNELGRPRLGIVASRKLGDAVRRNRAKRLVREVFRQNAHTAARSGIDVVVLPRRELFDAPYSSLEADFQTALRRSVARLPGAADGQQ